ncbi:hypothetical protein [Litoreibacter roseus]|uniref:Uncharacterized protein n=1 Tax=Litoreibacter roseus TaxID=2601869 RepID=A0A6N6JM63_9RHOB|nr:hypothetical protein [Litoreibacter roseus]GFE66960.1 hypothetical protein KIN_40340 [Litoreibacter roseus]
MQTKNTKKNARLSFRLSLLATTVAAIGIATPSYAFGGCSCGGVANIVRNARINVNNHTTEVGNYIVDNILRGVAQLSAYSKRETEAQTRIAEAQDQNAVLRERQVIRAAAEGGRYDPAVSACIDLSGIQNYGGGQTSQGVGGIDIANLSRNRSYGNGAAGEPVRQGGLALAQEIQLDRDRLRNVAGFADPTSDVRLLTEAITLDTSDQEVAQAYARMINNMVDPLPPKPITTQEAQTPTGLARIAARQIDATRRSASHAVFTYLGDIATPTGGTELATWAQNAAGPAYPYNVGDKVSSLQAVDIFVHSRFANPDWHQSIARMSPESVQRELLLTQALNLHVNWIRFGLERRVAAVEAAQLATYVDGIEGAGGGAPIGN